MDKMKSRYGILIAVIFFVAPVIASAQSRLRINEGAGISQAPEGSGIAAVSPRMNEGLAISPQPKLLPGENLRQEPYSPPQASPVPQAVPVLPPSPERGAYNPRTGESYPGVLGGAVNPRTGEILPKQGSGYLNPRTGEILPSKP